MILSILLILMNFVILVSGVAGYSCKFSDSSGSIDPVNSGASGAFC